MSFPRYLAMYLSILLFYINQWEKKLKAKDSDFTKKDIQLKQYQEMLRIINSNKYLHCETIVQQAEWLNVVYWQPNRGGGSVNC